MLHHNSLYLVQTLFIYTINNTRDKAQMSSQKYCVRVFNNSPNGNLRANSARLCLFELTGTAPFKLCSDIHLCNLRVSV